MGAEATNTRWRNAAEELDLRVSTTEIRGRAGAHAKGSAAGCACDAHSLTTKETAMKPPAGNVRVNAIGLEVSKLQVEGEAHVQILVYYWA